MYQHAGNQGKAYPHFFSFCSRLCSHAGGGLHSVAPVPLGVRGGLLRPQGCPHGGRHLRQHPHSRHLHGGEVFHKKRTSKIFDFPSQISLHLFFFSCPRYLAICHPLLFSSHSKVLRACCVILGIWAFGITYSLPWIGPNKVAITNYYVNQNPHQLVSRLFQVNFLVHPETSVPIPESAWCAIPFQNESESKIPLLMMLITTILFFVLPLVLVTTLYCR